MNSVNRVGIFFGHVASNIGDIAINRGQVELISAAYPDATIDVVFIDSHNNDYLSAAKASFGSSSKLSFHHFQSYDINALRYLARPGLLLEELGLQGIDLVCISSSEFLFEYQDQSNEKRLFWRLLPVLSAKAVGASCVILPSTYGPFETGRCRDLIKSTVSLLDGSAVRDSRSIDELHRLGIDEEVPKMLDPAFFIQPSVDTAPAADEVGSVLGVALRSENQGIRLASSVKKQRQAELSRQRYAESRVFKFGQRLISNHCENADSRVVIFVQTKADQELADALSSWAFDNSIGGSVSISSPVSIDEYLNALSSVDLLVASRFHALILATLVRKAVVPVYLPEHGHKIPGLCQLLGFNREPINLTTDDTTKAISVWLEQYREDPAGLRASDEKIDQFRERTIAWLKSVECNGRSNDDFQRMANALFPYADEISDRAQAALVKRRTRPYIRQVEEVQAENAKLTRAVSRAEGVSSAQREEVAGLRCDLQQLRDNLQIYDSKIGELELDLKMTRASFSFRIGNRIVRFARFPVRVARWMIRVPRRVMRKLPTLIGLRSDKKVGGAVRGRMAATAVKRDQKSSSTPLTDQLARLYADRGVQVVKSFLQQAFSDTEGEAASNEVISLLKCIREDLDADAQRELSRLAIGFCKSESTLRMAFWTAQRIKDFWFAAEMLDEMEALAREEPEAVDMGKLGRLRRSPVYAVLALRGLAPRGERKVKPQAKKIAYVLHNSLPYSSGGYATRSHGVVSGLKSAGYDVVVLSRPGFPLDIVHDLSPSDVPPMDVIDGTRYVRTLYPVRRGTPPKNYIEEAARSLELRFAEERPEFVIAASNNITGLPALIAARRLGIPFVYEVRGLWEITRLSREAEFVDTPLYHTQRFLEATVAQEADHVLTLTQPLKDELVSRGVQADRITLFPNSCDLDRFSVRSRDEALAEELGIPPGVPVIGYVGTFVQYEGLDDLAEACAHLKESGTKFRLLLVGNENASGDGRGEISEKILSIAEKHHFLDWLIMPGRVTHDKVSSYYSLIDIAPFPRKPQPVCEMVSPMKPLEALAMEKAVVVSSVAALSEMIMDGKTGLVFEKGNVRSLCESIKAILDDAALRGSLGEAGREWVAKERTWEASVEKVVPKLRELTTRGEKAPVSTSLERGTL